MPESIFFIPCEDGEGNRQYEISLNGGGYPAIDEVEKMLTTFKNFYKKIKHFGQPKIDKINKEIEEIARKEQYQMWNNMESKPKKLAQKGFIYIVKSNNLYKIGRALDIKQRTKTYRTENPFGIQVVFQKEVSDYIKIEKQLLDKFKNKQFRGEWFRLDKNDVKWVEKSI